MLIMSLAETEVVERRAVAEPLVTSIDVLGGPGGTTTLDDDVASTAELEDSTGVGVGEGVGASSLSPNSR